MSERLHDVHYSAGTNAPPLSSGNSYERSAVCRAGGSVLGPHSGPVLLKGINEPTYAKCLVQPSAQYHLH